MLLPRAQEIRRRMTTKTFEFRGYNANPVVAPGELTAMTNLGSNNYPCISNRSPRSSYATITTPNALFAANGKLAWVDGTSFKYDGNAKGTVTSGAKSMVDFNDVILIFPDKKYYDIVNNTFGTIGTGTYPTAGSCPDIDYACVHSNRVFGVKGNDIYACKLGTYTDWTTFAGVDTDAYATDVAEDGSFVGIVSFQNHVVFFKNDYLYELYGDVPRNFRIKTVAQKGTVDRKSVVEVNGILFFLSRDGVNVYGGGLPKMISQSLNESTYTSGAAGTDGRKYYISLYNGSTYKLFVYDTLYGVWHKEDTLRVVEFAQMNGSLYAMSNETTSKIYIFKSGTETVSWTAETEIFDQSFLGKKHHGKIRVKAELSTGTTLNIYVKSDNNAYELVKTYTTTQLQVITHQFIPKRCNNFQIKFEGSGDIEIYALEIEIDLSTDV